MKKFLLTQLIVLLFPTILFAVEKNDIVGLWYFSDKYTERIFVAEIFEHKGKYYAVAIANKTLEKGKVEQPEKDIANPDPSLRNRPVDQVAFINDVSFNGEKWVDGEIYDIAKGKYYYLSSGTLKSDGVKLIWKGSIDRRGVFGQRIIWAKVKNVDVYESLRKTEEEIVAIVPNKRFK